MFVILPLNGTEVSFQVSPEVFDYLASIFVNKQVIGTWDWDFLCFGNSGGIKAITYHVHSNLISADIDECSVSKNGGCSHKCVNTDS